MSGRLTLPVALLVGAAFGTATAVGIHSPVRYGDGPPPAHTGGFGEPTCRACHFDGPRHADPGALRLEGTPRVYEPGRSYVLTVSLRSRGLRRAGFQLSARFAAGAGTGEGAGVLEPTSPRVQVVAGPDSGAIGYAEQTRSGARVDPPGRAIWRLSWHAPSEAAGPVLFHVAANAANDDASEFGDTIHTARALSQLEAPRWRPQAVGTHAEFRGLSAAGRGVVWAAGRGGVYARTTDGGDTWDVGTVPGADSLFFVDVHATDGERAQLLGTHFAGGLARIYATDDGGASWSLRYEDRRAGAFYDGMAVFEAEEPARGLVFGDPVNGRFTIGRTDDGSDWARVAAENIPLPLEGEVGFAASGTAIVTAGQRRAWIGTGGGRAARVLRTTDGGRSWTAVETPLAAAASAGIFGLAFRDTLYGIAVGGDYRRSHAADPNVLITADGGATWHLVGSARPAGVRYGVVYVRAGTVPLAVAVGPSGSGYTPDDGLTWATIDTLGYNTVAAGPDGSVWAAGVEGRIARLER